MKSDFELFYEKCYELAQARLGPARTALGVEAGKGMTTTEAGANFLVAIHLLAECALTINATPEMVTGALRDKMAEIGAAAPEKGDSDAVLN